jgi:L-fuculose-phosphate aldolase
MDALAAAHGHESTARAALVEVGRRLERKGLIVALDGNLSVRLDDDVLLVTPSGVPKGEMTPDDLVRTDLAGQPLGPGQPSSEIGMHLGVYAQRPDVRAVIHAHPPTAIAHTVAGVSLAEPLMPEAWVELGPVPTVALAQPGTDAMREQVETPIRTHDVLMLERHGSLTVGPDLRVAMSRLEFLEQSARVSLIARLLATGPLAPLPADLQAALRPEHPDS